MPNTRPPKGGKKPLGISLHWWIIGGVATAGIVYYSYHKQSKAAAASTATATTAGVDPTIDPATGIPYADEYTGDSYGGYGAYSGGSAAGGNGGAGYYPATPVAVAPQTNADWMSSAEAALQAAGYSQTAITAALGGYLIGVPLPPDSLAIVEAATAQIGPPPSPPFLNILPSQTNAPTTPTAGSRTPTTTATAAPSAGFDALTPAQNNDAHYLTSPTLAAQRIAQEYTNRGQPVPTASTLAAMAKSAIQSGSFTASRTLVDAKAGLAHN